MSKIRYKKNVKSTNYFKPSSKLDTLSFHFKKLISGLRLDTTTCIIFKLRSIT